MKTQTKVVNHLKVMRELRMKWMKVPTTMNQSLKKTIKLKVPKENILASYMFLVLILAKNSLNTIFKPPFTPEF